MRATWAQDAADRPTMDEVREVLRDEMEDSAR